MVAGLLVTLVACAALALVGAHLGLAWSLVPGGMAALMSDSEGFLSQVLAEGLLSLQTRPLSIPWASPAVRLGAMLAGILPAIVYVAVIMAKTRNDRAGEESGSSRWATTAEIRRFATTNNPSPDNLILLSEHAALPFTRTDFDQEHDRNVNVAVIGGSGSGKTRYYVKPNVAQLWSDYIITDPKGDLLPDVGQMLVDNGYHVRSFNTFVTEQSLVYNPFHYVRTDLEIEEFVTAFFALTSSDQKKGGDQFWDDAAMLLMGALIAFLRDYAPPADYNFGGLMRLLDIAEAAEDSDSFKSPLDRLFDQIETGYRPEVVKGQASTMRHVGDGRWRTMSVPASSRVSYKPSRLYSRALGMRPYDNVLKGRDGRPLLDASGRERRGFSPAQDFGLRCYKKFRTAAGKTLKSIIISVNVKFNAISTAEVSRVLNGEDQMRLDELGDPGQHTALFCTFKDTNQQTLGFLHGLLVFQAMNVMADKAIRKHGGKLPTPVHLILDEFKSLHLPKSTSDLISVIRSRNMSMSVILQSVSQLDELYDEATANSILDCCDTMVFLGGKSKKTTEMIAGAIGKQTITTTNVTSQHGGGRGWSKSMQRQARDLMDSAEVGRLRRTDCIVLINGCQPYMDHKYPLEQHPRYELMDPGHRARGRFQTPVGRQELRNPSGEVVASGWVVRPMLRRPVKAAVYQSRFDLAAYLAAQEGKGAVPDATDAGAGSDGADAREAATGGATTAPPDT